MPGFTSAATAAKVWHEAAPIRKRVLALHEMHRNGEEVKWQDFFDDLDDLEKEAKKMRKKRKKEQKKRRQRRKTYEKEQDEDEKQKKKQQKRRKKDKKKSKNRRSGERDPPRRRDTRADIHETPEEERARLIYEERMQRKMRERRTQQAFHDEPVRAYRDDTRPRGAPERRHSRPYRRSDAAERSPHRHRREPRQSEKDQSRSNLLGKLAAYLR